MNQKIISYQTKINRATSLEQSMVIVEIDHQSYTLVFHQESLLAFGRTKTEYNDNMWNTSKCPITNSQIHTFLVEGMNRIIRKAEKAVPDGKNEISSYGITHRIPPLMKNIVLKMLKQQQREVLVSLSDKLHL